MEKEENTTLQKIKTALSDLYIKGDKERRSRGDDLGIFFYITCWFFIILLFTFSEDTYLISMNLFYLAFDFLSILFIALYLFEKKSDKRELIYIVIIISLIVVASLLFLVRSIYPTYFQAYELLYMIFFYGIIILAFLIIIALIYNIVNKDYLEFEKEKETLFRFYKFTDFIYMFLFIISLFLIYSLINYLIAPLMQNAFLSGDFANELFSLLRVPTTEELVFRGMGIFIIVFILSGVFNSNRNGKNYERNETIIWWMAIILTSIMFGLYHFPKFYNPATFPYFYLNLSGHQIKIHIFFPIFFLTLLGIMLGVARMRYGIFASIMLHIINNYYATAIIYFILTIG